MTNLEKYYDKLTDAYGIDKTTKKIISCGDLYCSSCMLDSRDGRCIGDLLNPIFSWLNKEYKEPYEITPEELAFCNMVHTGVLWRNHCNQLMYSHPNYNKTLSLDLKIFPPFTFVYDDTPINIEDILNNHVLKESK